MDRPLFPGFSMIEAGQLYARRFEERSRNLALDFAQSRALLVLAENEGVTQRVSELASLWQRATFRWAKFWRLLQLRARQGYG